jgi:hypothetical protein
MNRRDFLKLLSIGAAFVAAPKLIFDMGKNSHIYTPKESTLYGCDGEVKLVYNDMFETYSYELIKYNDPINRVSIADCGWRYEPKTVLIKVS